MSSASQPQPAFSERPSFLCQLADNLYDRYLESHDLADLDQAISLLDQAVDLFPAATNELLTCLCDLGGYLCERYMRSGSMPHLAQAVEVLEKATSLPNVPLDERATAVSELANAVGLRYTAEGLLSDLSRAIALSETAVSFSPIDTVRRVGRLSNLSNLLRTRFSQTGNPSDLDRAIDVAAEAVAAEHTAIGFYHCRAALGEALMQRYIAAKNPYDLRRALELLQNAVALAPSSAPDRATVMANLATTFFLQYQATNRMSDLDQAEMIVRDALQFCAPDSPDRAFCMNLLGTLKRARYTQTGNTKDLQSAQESFDEAVRVTPLDSPHRAVRVSDQLSTFHDRYLQTGSEREIDEMIANFEQALKAVPIGSLARPTVLANLSAALRERHEKTGSMSDLDRAIENSRQAIALAPVASVNQPTNLNALASALITRHQRRGSASDLDEAIGLYEQALAVSSDRGSERQAILNNLASALRLRHQSTALAADLSRSIQCVEESISLTPSDSPRLMMRLNNLANALLDRFEEEGDDTDLDSGISKLQAAVELCPEASPALPRLLSNFATSLRLRYERTASRSDLRVAVSAYRRACELGLESDLHHAFIASQNWATWALRRGRWRESANAFGFALTAVEQLLRSQMLREDKEAWLRIAQKVPINSAYVFARIGDIATAVRILEGTRTRLLSDALERIRFDLNRLADSADAPLLIRYRSAADELARLQETDDDVLVSSSTLDKTIALSAARAEMEAAIEAIRSLPGYGDFFATPDHNAVHSALIQDGHGGEATGAYLLTTPAGTLVLLVHQQGYLPVFLDEVVEDDFSMLSSALKESAAVGVAPGSEILAELLRIVGEHIIGPTLTALNNVQPAVRKAEPAPSLTIIPTGSWSLIPVHAATYDTEGGRRTLLDDFAVSYSPSARALLHANAALQGRTKASAAFVGVGNPLPVRQSYVSLPYASAEVKEIALVFDTSATLCEADATLQNLLVALRSACYVHFACHGKFDAGHPLDSALVLSERDLTLAELLKMQALGSVRLVTLSACQTAVTDFADLPEESIGLPSAFLQLGAPGVLATLWPVDDWSTMLLMIKFYEVHKKGDGKKPPQAPAHALRAAQLWLRDITFGQLANFLETDGRRRFLPAEVVEDKLTNYTLQPENDRPFREAQSWAAFSFTGR